MDLTVPEANLSLYVLMALAITFSLNIIAGIPIYLRIEYIITWDTKSKDRCRGWQGNSRDFFRSLKPDCPIADS